MQNVHLPARQGDCCYYYYHYSYYNCYYYHLYCPYYCYYHYDHCYRNYYYYHCYYKCCCYFDYYYSYSYYTSNKPGHFAKQDRQLFHTAEHCETTSGEVAVLIN